MGLVTASHRVPLGTDSWWSSKILVPDAPRKRTLTQFTERCLDVKIECIPLLVHFVLATWVADRLPVAPYLSIVGLPESGKTTLLRVLSLVCRRPLLVADITSAAFYEACAQIKPTLLIDESGTPGDNRALRHLLRMGTTPDVLAMRKGRVFDAFGPKVVCWREPPDDPALNSRCIEIQMRETKKTTLYRLTDPSLNEQAMRLQAQLLQFRFENYKKVVAPTIPDVHCLRPRSRELFYVLAAPCGEDVEICQLLLDLFKNRDLFTQEPLSPEASVVLTALFSQIHQTAYEGRVLINDLTTKVNSIFEATGERLRLSPRKVGAVLSTFGIGWKRRTKIGWTTLLECEDQARIHELVEKHGIDHNLVLGADLRDCPLCDREKRPTGTQTNAT